MSFELQIEKYKKSVDSRGQFNQLEISPRNENQESDNVESNIEYNMSENSVMLNMSTSRILTGILIFIFLGVLVLLVKFAKHYSYDFQIVRLIGSNIAIFIIQIVLPLIIIVRCENIFIFFKKQILKILKLCKCTMCRRGEP